MAGTIVLMIEFNAIGFMVVFLFVSGFRSRSLSVTTLYHET